VPSQLPLQDQIENLIRQTGDMSTREIAAHFPCLKRDGGKERNNRVGKALASLILRGRIDLIEETTAEYTEAGDVHYKSRYVYRWKNQSH
jgi:hypothetical protein